MRKQIKIPTPPPPLEIQVGQVTTYLCIQRSPFFFFFCLYQSDTVQRANQLGCDTVGIYPVYAQTNDVQDDDDAERPRTFLGALHASERGGATPIKLPSRRRAYEVSNAPK